MTDLDFECFFIKRDAAAAAYVSGDPSRLDYLVVKEGEATYHSPRGYSVTGADRVAARFREDASSFGPGGESRFEILQKSVSDDFGFWTGFQIAKVRILGQDQSTDMRIRVTEVFRRLDGEWKLIHRHADVSHPSNAPRQS